MTQQTRNSIANVMLVVSILAIIVFIVTHFTMTPPRPSWRRDLVWVALIFTIAARAVRGRRGWRAERPTS